MTTKVHRPFIFIVLFYASGILFSSFFEFPFKYICLLALSLLCIVIVFIKKNFIKNIFILFIIFFAGSLSVQSRLLIEKDHILHIRKFYRKQPIGIKGVVVSDVKKTTLYNRHKTSFAFKVEAVNTKWGLKEKQGKILVNIFNDIDICYGDYLYLEGKLHYPYNFSNDKRSFYKDYLSRRDMHLILSVKKNSLIKV
ncbi:MAG: DUF4131 domain-containing protein [Candidatus Zapsychrus exili]|nr:DUF4131 domain-containing protein [Candidatus Zapsychrus exili]